MSYDITDYDISELCDKLNGTEPVNDCFNDEILEKDAYFAINNYDINVQLNDENSLITFKVFDRKSFQLFDKQIDNNYFNLPFSMDIIFILISQSFEQENNIKFANNNNNLEMKFDLLIENIPLSIDIILDGKKIIDIAKYQELENDIHRLNNQNKILKEEYNKLWYKIDYFETLSYSLIYDAKEQERLGNKKDMATLLTVSLLLKTNIETIRHLTEYYMSINDYKTVKNYLEMAIKEGDNDSLEKLRYYQSEESKLQEYFV